MKSEHPQAQRDLDLTVQEGTILVKRAAYGAEHESEEQVRVPIFGLHAARIGVSGSMTLNLGDHQFAKIEVRIELPCYPEDSEVNRAYSIASQKVDEMLNLEKDYATGSGEDTGQSTE